MSEYTIGICDDDKEFVHHLSELCENVLNNMNIQYTLKQFYCEDDILRDISKGGNSDLLLLDIKLGKKNGIEFARKLKEQGNRTSIVLMTVDNSFLLEGYSVQPIYFLMKPIDIKELEKAIKTDLKRKVKDKNIFIKCECMQIPISIDSILYIEVIDHTVTVHTRTKDYSTRMTLTQLLDILPPSYFVRCHNSFAVNLARVSQFSRNHGIILDNRVSLPIGRKYFECFKENFINFINTY